MKYCKWCGLGFEYIRTTKVCCSKKCKAAEYYEENKEKIAEYYEENKVKIAEYNKENKVKIAEYGKEYRKANKEKIAEQSREYQKENAEKLAEYNKEYKKAHPEKTRECKRKRRAMKLEVKENYTKQDEQYTYALFSNKCFNCGSIENLCIDHIYPLSLGHALTRTNACVLCKSCNCSKHNSLPEDFYNIDKLADLIFLVKIRTNEWQK